MAEITGKLLVLVDSEVGGEGGLDGEGSGTVRALVRFLLIKLQSITVRVPVQFFIKTTLNKPIVGSSLRSMNDAINQKTKVERIWVNIYINGKYQNSGGTSTVSHLKN